MKQYKRGKKEQAKDVGKRLGNRIRADLARRGVDISSLPTTPPATRYECNICNDIGMVRAGDFEVNHPMFGKMVPCACRQAEGNPEVADAYTGLFPRDLTRTWDSLVEIDALDTNLDEAKQAVQKVLSNGYGWVYLWGGYGTAKSAILKTACAYATRDAALYSGYARMQDIIDEILAAYDKGQKAAVAQVGRWSHIHVLAVDELEKVSESRETVKRRFQIFDHRYSASLDGRYGITIMAGNVPPMDLDPALASRILDGRNHVVELKGKDVRPYTLALNLD